MYLLALASVPGPPHSPHLRLLHLRVHFNCTWAVHTQSKCARKRGIRGRSGTKGMLAPYNTIKITQSVQNASDH
jgi:hypothetical protein